jgi:hypothetical protein
MKLFPTVSVGLGRLGTARFLGVRRTPDGCVGRYAVMPADMVVFVERLGALRGRLGRRYEPFPGMWASLLVPGADPEHLELHVGLGRSHGLSLARGHRAVRSSAECVVSPRAVRALALGYVERMAA